jgi:hypothetical protein
MERQLPGLNEIAGLLEDILPAMVNRSLPQTILAALEPVRSAANLERLPESLRHQFAGAKGPVTNDSLGGAIPQSDQVSRQQLLVLLQLIEQEASALGNSADSDIGDGLRMLTVNTHIHKLRDFEKNILRRISLFEGRLARFRRELENYFGD